jgi:hypothetical protein
MRQRQNQLEVSGKGFLAPIKKKYRCRNYLSLVSEYWIYLELLQSSCDHEESYSKERERKAGKKQNKTGSMSFVNELVSSSTSLHLNFL